MEKKIKSAGLGNGGSVTHYEVTVSGKIIHRIQVFDANKKLVSSTFYANEELADRAYNQVEV